VTLERSAYDKKVGIAAEEWLERSVHQIRCRSCHCCQGVITNPYPEERLNFACISGREEERESRGGEEKAEGGDRRGGGGGEAGGATSPFHSS
jgi:hypothetical protein